VAYAAADALRTAAAALGSRTLRHAADDYDRAARQPYGRIPGPTPAGNQLRHAARLISAYAHLTEDRTLTPMVLIVRLAALAEALAELRESQQHAAQAAAALRAARHLRTATRDAPPTRPPGRPATATLTATGLAALSFPTTASRHPAPSQPGPGPRQPPPPRRPPLPRPRGPTR
jgi:hypothetical protein